MLEDDGDTIQTSWYEKVLNTTVGWWAISNMFVRYFMKLFKRQILEKIEKLIFIKPESPKTIRVSGTSQSPRLEYSQVNFPLT